ncbi:Uncharacterised protein [Halioglobus japonicus]|nr:Uncharacterised protein [Halioglobus japonicus]
MKLHIVDQQPQELVHYPEPPALREEQIQHIVEIFNTPLTGAYNWDYTIQDDRINKLYNLGKQLNWDAEIDVDWSQTPNVDELAPRTAEEKAAALAQFREGFPFADYGPYLAMDDDTALELHRHLNSWFVCQFLHGEQGALLVASQLASCAPTYNAKLYAASQTFDEARHVEVFNKFIQTKVGLMYPVNDSLKALLDKILTDPRWDLKFIGMQIIIEGLALAAFNVAKMTTKDPVFSQLLHLVTRDEARHVTFGVNYLEEHVKTLSQQEKEERAQFALEACIVMRERMIPTDVHARFGWDTSETREISLGGKARQEFRNLVFSRVVPNLKRIGLLTEAIRPKFEELGLLEFEHLPDDGTIDWVEMSKPL